MLALWNQIKAGLGLVVLGAALGFGGAYRIYKPKPAPVEVASAAVRQADHSLELARVPDAKAKPKQDVPVGAKVERIVHVDVQPNAAIPEVAQSPVSVTHDSAVVSLPSGLVGAEPHAIGPVACPPVGVDLTLFRLADGTHRVTASSPNGTILGSSVDIPVENAAPARELRNSAGAFRDASGAWTGVYTRDVGPIRILAEVAPKQGAMPQRAGIGVALRF